MTAMTNNKSAKCSWYAATALALAIPAFLLAQNSLVQNVAKVDRHETSASSDKDTRPYDKHDFNGLWARNPSAQFGQPPCPECRNVGPIEGYFVTYGFFGDVPPRTAEGEKRFQMNRPTKGYVLGSKDALEHMDIEIGFRRAVPSKLSNDPAENCEPLGLMRLVSFSGGNAAMQIVQTNEIIVQKFEWFWDNREIWTDGRSLPRVEDYLPRFNGYSVGKWEGDTLVVTTVGFDDRQWLDGFGYPVSDKAVLEERYSRPSRNRLRLDMTLTDPVNYTRPWHSNTKVWGLIPKEAMSIAGWSGLVEDRCIPSDNNLFRSFEPDAPGGKKDK
jgi:hypothetical protein